MTRIGLISDTHGLLRPDAIERLRGCAHIVHAGDICDPSVLEALGAIAPVTAVRGNNDVGGWARALERSVTVELAGVWLHVVHDLADVLPATLDPRVRVVVTGHSHKPLVAERAGRLWINPGSAGPRRFTLPISLGELRVADGVTTAHLHTLG